VVKRVVYATIGVIILALAGSIPAYLALGQEGGQQANVTITVQPSFSTPGGGGGSAVEIPGCPAGEVATTGRAASTGLVFQDLVIKSFDKRLRLLLNQGTVILTPDGKCPRCIGIHEMTPPPSPPEGARLIGAGYDVAPDLTAFTPPATIIYSYDPKDIPEGITEENLSIALYDEATGEWMKLECLVDTEAHTITAKIGRFNDLAVLGYEPVAAPAPASFQSDYLTISPGEIETGQTVNISLTVTNGGECTGSCPVMLRIEGVVEEIKEITLEAGDSETVSFSVARQLAGTYSVEVNGLTGSFEVKQPQPTAVEPTPAEPTPTEPTNWWLIVIIIATLAAAAAIYFYRGRLSPLYQRSVKQSRRWWSQLRRIKRP
jgi:hypothetical protein